MKQFVFFLPSSFSDTIIQIILCPKKKQCVDFTSSLKDLLQQNRIDCELLGEPFVTNVAKHSPRTREQFNEASSCWPVNFHEDKQYVERGRELGLWRRGVGWGPFPFLVIIFMGRWHAGKDIFLDSILKREYIFGSFIYIF